MANENRCPCGGVIFADTEDWVVPLCHPCYLDNCVDEYTADLSLNDTAAIEKFWEWMKEL